MGFPSIRTRFLHERVYSGTIRTIRSCPFHIFSLICIVVLERRKERERNAPVHQTNPCINMSKSFGMELGNDFSSEQVTTSQTRNDDSAPFFLYQSRETWQRRNSGGLLSSVFGCSYSHLPRLYRALDKFLSTDRSTNTGYENILKRWLELDSNYCSIWNSTDTFRCQNDHRRAAGHLRQRPGRVAFPNGYPLPLHFCQQPQSVRLIFVTCPLLGKCSKLYRKGTNNFLTASFLFGPPLQIEADSWRLFGFRGVGMEVHVWNTTCSCTQLPNYFFLGGDIENNEILSLHLPRHKATNNHSAGLDRGQAMLLLFRISILQ